MDNLIALKLVKKFINFPQAKVCKHYIALEIINVLQNEVIFSPELIDSILDADDEFSLKEIDKLLEQK